MPVFSPPISFSNQPYLGVAALLFRCQNKITEESLKITFSLLILITIMRTPKTWDNRIHIPFNFLFITINIYVSIIKVKAYDENSVHKFRN